MVSHFYALIYNVISMFMHYIFSFPSWEYYSGIRAYLGSACEDIASMLSEEEEGSHRKEKTHRKDKGKSPLFGELEGNKFPKLLLQTTHELNR